MKAAGLVLLAGDPGRRGVRRDPLLEEALARFGRARPGVAYVGAASQDNRLFFLWISSLLKKAGAGAVRLAPLAGRRGDPQQALAILEDADVVFVSGGDVGLGMGILGATGLDGPLRRLGSSGKPFIGLSAGSIMLARSWVAWADESNDASAAPFPCLGLAPLLCDTHGEGEGWQELRMLLRLTGEPSGFGIPAGAALAVGRDGSLAALGKPVRRLTATGSLDNLEP
ncbi:MAG TPA: Type 1 glutamine amidotransferase-like domain-containing protein [Candidatus Aminicenantes bacterium]|nr:Type 1 glutamine amidotransferase-like domain-containing protein [Candidatus Aminicenantes bacterium]